MSKIVSLQDGTLIEIESEQAGLEECSYDSSRKKLKKSLSDIKPFLVNVAGQFRDTLTAIEKNVNVDSMQVQVGLSFEGEGNVYIVKGKAGASLNVTLTLKPNEHG